MKPIIGITPSPSEDQFSHGLFYRYALSSNYTEAIEAAGGVPLIIPPQHDNIDEILSVVDGLLLSGGGDIDPKIYGDDSVHETTYGIHEGRDTLEMALTKAAVERDLPTLCICRGIQVLNVALGGTLIQDIADQYSDQIQHRQHETGIEASEPSHEVQAERDSLLGDVYEADTIETNSFHHQALGEGKPGASRDRQGARRHCRVGRAAGKHLDARRPVAPGDDVQGTRGAPETIRWTCQGRHAVPREGRPRGDGCPRLGAL